MSRRLFIKLLLSLGLGAYFPKLVEASRYEKLYTPQDGYEPLRQVKFLRQLITQDSRTSRVIMWQCEKFLDTQLELELIGEGGANFCVRKIFCRSVRNFLPNVIVDALRIAEN